MPWKETRVEEERLKFIVASLDKESGWSMSELCAAFGVSRKSGYKWLQRYRDAGLDGLRERRRAPLHHPNATPAETVGQLIAARKQHRFWGPRKLVATLKRAQPGLEWPAPSTAGAIRKRHGLVPPRRRRRSAVGVVRAALRTPTHPNHVWAVDYKGWFRLGDGALRSNASLPAAPIKTGRHPVGLDAVSDRHWTITFGPIELRLFDTPTRKLLAYTRPTRRDRAEARTARAVVEHSSRPSGSFRSPQPLQGSPEKE